MSQDKPVDGDMSAPVPSAPTEGLPEGLLAPGQVLGDRYQIRSQLGRGGMGEVWRAFDLKLRVEVALKALLPDLFKDERRRDLLRREVRAAREVVSPNVCRIFDLVEAGGNELVSMEYVDGGTLLDVLRERGPLDLKEAQDIASQFLAGLEAIHKAGLIHRDIKPENIMLTRAGRVVVMDFGLARQEASGAGTVSGTPAYMAPEQAAGLKVDARADVYAAGVVLAEMVCPEGIKNLESRQSVWEGIRHEPARVPDTPWAPVLKKAVAKEPDQRYNSAHTLTRALEDVTLRVEGADDLTPYPGLASFTEADAEYFFGREAEIEQMWRRLERPHLLALIGPSGAGKSSFLRAGLIPTIPPGWAHIIYSPGNAPFASMRRAVISELEGDTDALQELAIGDEDATVSAISRWRRQHEHALIIVDQFEELFTLNSPEIQDRFAELLGRLALEADAQVLLSMRDDFFFHCHPFEALAPLQDGLTMLGPPVGAALRRALVQPANKCGYRFEDKKLVDEMLTEVEGERGALPMLAFAAARMWESRDRDEGRLTRQSYQDIGGVSGALAQHAESTLTAIGEDRAPIVRELFRNLVTSESTRAVPDVDELLSVFDQSQSEAAAEVLRVLIDSRLLTSYELQVEGDKPHRRVEIIHESLLETWPRLVRWQTQDEEGAQLRDELRQAARAWHEHDRPEDRLWTGTAFREFQLWSERYPGGLTDTEEAFGDSMTALAGRRRRRRRIAVAAIIAVLIVGLTVVGAFWQRSVRETLRAEAATLLSQAQVELESYPSAAVAYATASLELSDSSEARRLAQEALWKGPTALVVNEDRTWRPTFSPDGRWLVQSVDLVNPGLRVIGADGTSELLEQIYTEDTKRIGVRMDRESGAFLSIGSSGERRGIGLWSAPERRLLAKRWYEPGEASWPFTVISSQRRALVGVREDGKLHFDVLRFDGTYERLGTVDLGPQTTDVGTIRAAPDHATGGRIWVATDHGHDVFVVEVGEHHLSQPRLVFRQESSIVHFDVDPLGRFVATTDEEGLIRLWDIAGSSPPKTIRSPDHEELLSGEFVWDGSLLIAHSESESERPVFWLWSLAEDEPRLLRRVELVTPHPWATDVDPIGLRIAKSGDDPKTRIWSLGRPADAEPLILARSAIEFMFWPRFSPGGRWLATADSNGLILWPLDRQYPSVIGGLGGGIGGLAFGPEGRWLASSSWDGTVRLWPLEGDAPPPGRVLFNSPPGESELLRQVAVSPDGESLLVGTENFGVWLISRVSGEFRKMPVFEGGAWGVSFSPDGRLAAAVGGAWSGEIGVVRVWEVATGDEVAVLAATQEPNFSPILFTGDREILTASDLGLRRWDLNTGNCDVVYEGVTFHFAASNDGQRVGMIELPEESALTGRAVILDLDTGAVTPLETHGNRLKLVALDSTGTIVVTGDLDGVVRVGSAANEEPHLLLGHEGPIYALAIDPQGRWIASLGQDKTVRLWPMPDLSKPPLHTLPREELINKLKTLTNLRVVRDEESATGWTLTHDPFPGWETVPTW